eukprot:1418_1
MANCAKTIWKANNELTYINSLFHHLKRNEIVADELSVLNNFLSENQYDTDALKEDIYSNNSNISHFISSYSHMTNYFYLIREYVERTNFQLRECSYLTHMIKILNTSNITQLSGVDILNTFNHLLSIHDTEIEDLYNIFITECNKQNMCKLSKCLHIARNHRNRDKSNANVSELETLYCCDIDSKWIAIQQIIDKVHCHFFHTFDIGYKLTRKALHQIKQNIRETEQHSYQHTMIRETIKHIRSIKTPRNYIHDKFVTNVDEKVDDNYVWYEYGNKYYYWNYYKNNQETNFQQNKFCDWYISAKYTDFKTEMIHNSICTLTAFQWLVLKKKAECHHETDRCRNIVKSAGVQTYLCEVQPCEQVSISHIMAMMIYCNNDKLQGLFSQTYRLKNPTESNDSLKERHSNFAHLGRLLVELIEFYVDETEDAREKRPHQFYHGISTQCKFEEIVAHISVPLSTSTELSVAVSFCANTGMILQLEMDEKYRTHYESYFFECEWLSDYPNEREKFFVGGFMVELRFRTIINAVTGVDYEYYIKAIVTITEKLGEEEMNIVNGITREHKLVWIMLLHAMNRLYPHNEKYENTYDIPSYIVALFYTHMTHRRKLTIRYCNIEYASDVAIPPKIIKPKQCLFQQILIDEYTWINMITGLFSSLVTLQVKVDYILLSQDSFYLSILRVLQSNTKLKLENIELSYYQLNKSYKQNMTHISTMIRKYATYFEEQNWVITEWEGFNDAFIGKDRNVKVVIRILKQSEYIKIKEALENDDSFIDKYRYY